mgnify:CR=1 FL=1|tara:strand:- start:7209 stop:7778 length:570 start_codon:yes stop_codon:yes gene_type:complete
MAFLDSSTAVIDAILTRKGRELLAKNDGSFKITKFAFGDDEINYQLFDVSNSVNPEQDILNLPILEPISNERVALLNRLVTLPKGTLKISTLQLQPTVATADFGTDVRVDVSTENGTDSQGYTATVRDLDIAVLDNLKATLDDNGVGTFIIKTGANAGGKSGETKVDIIGINTGARKEFTLTISATATT